MVSAFRILSSNQLIPLKINQLAYLREIDNRMLKVTLPTILQNFDNVEFVDFESSSRLMINFCGHSLKFQPKINIYRIMQMAT